jgi:ubiquinone/menaquinone biosynthesis C-methylase UbiE
VSADKRLMEIFLDTQRGLPRQGPGNDASTLRALALCADLGPTPDVLDIGCGPGAQTMALAGALEGRITAVDVYEEYLDELRERSTAAGLKARIAIERADMMRLPFAAESFDLVWAEGAAYIMGFERAFAAWRPMVRPGGYVAVTELTWLTSEQPPEVAAFYRSAYPQMTDIETNLASIRVAGYDVVDHFVLPEAAWWDDYYGPLEAKLPALKDKYAGDTAALAIVGSSESEIAMRRDHAAAYGYVFYVARKAS